MAIQPIVVDISTYQSGPKRTDRGAGCHYRLYQNGRLSQKAVTVSQLWIFPLHQRKSVSLQLPGCFLTVCCQMGHCGLSLDTLLQSSCCVWHWWAYSCVGSFHHMLHKNSVKVLIPHPGITQWLCQMTTCQSIKEVISWVETSWCTVWAKGQDIWYCVTFSYCYKDTYWCMYSSLNNGMWVWVIWGLMNTLLED